MALSNSGNGRRLLLVGWDGADWKLITPLLESDQMPCLAGLIERGVMGKLSSLAPMVSPLLWTSLATGMRADKHGILGDQELDRERGVLQPISGRTRRSAAVWNILHQQGLKGHTINWPATHPAEALDGVFVSDRYPRATAAFADDWSLEPGTIFPARWEAALAGLRLHPAELDGEALLPFLPRLKRIDQRHDPRVVTLAAIFAEMVSTQAAATWALEHQPWDFAAIHYGGLEQLGHRFLRYQAPRLEDVSPRDAEDYGEVVSAGYRFHDLMLARLLQLAGTDVTVMLVSDHGFCTREFRPRGPRAASALSWHRGQGVFCLAGPGIRRDELLHQAGILDVAPTVLTLFGLPVGADMDGHPLLAAWEELPTPQTIPSWEEVVRMRTPRSAAPRSTAGEADAALAELESLGYRDELPSGSESLQRLLRRLETFHLALVHRHTGHPDQAVPLLKQLLDEEPDNDTARLYLAACHYLLGQHDQCRRLIADRGTDAGPLSREEDLLSALILLAEGKASEALVRLEAARQTRLREPQVFCFIGRGYLLLERWTEAEDAFGQALRIDEDCVGAHYGLAIAFARRRRWGEAADAALTAVGLDHHLSDAHYVLGLALVHMRQPARALRAFETVLAQRPDSVPARTWVQTLREPCQ
jgi:tetratricopeptide (TPR) repeat protein